MSLPKLDFRLLSSSSSEITEGSLDELKKPLSKSKGWHSSKYCTYPQNIYIVFLMDAPKKESPRFPFPMSPGDTWGRIPVH